jgi:hypothetical protein
MHEMKRIVKAKKNINLASIDSAEGFVVVCSSTTVYLLSEKTMKFGQNIWHLISLLVVLHTNRTIKFDFTACRCVWQQTFEDEPINMVYLRKVGNHTLLFITQNGGFIRCTSLDYLMRLFGGMVVNVLI